MDSIPENVKKDTRRQSQQLVAESEPAHLNGNGKRHRADVGMGSNSVRSDNTQTEGWRDRCDTFCRECRIMFVRPYTFRRHMNDIHGLASKFVCDQGDCHKAFTRKDTFMRHKRVQHGSGKVCCPCCGGFIRKDGLREHLDTNRCRRHRSDSVLGMVDLPPLIRNTMSWLPNVDERNNRLAMSRRLSELQREAQSSTLFGNEIARQSFLSGTPEANVASNHHNQIAPLIDNSSATHRERNSRACVSSTEDNPNTLTGASFRESEADVNAKFDTKHNRLSRVLNKSALVTKNLTLKEFKNYNFKESNSTLDELTERAMAWEGMLQKSEGLVSNARLGFTGKDSEFSTLPLKSMLSRDPIRQMSLPSLCPLCLKPLGSSLEAVFKHAKTHLERPPRPQYECSTCTIKFAYKHDHALHSTQLNTMSFCQEIPPVETEDEADWVAEACSAARVCFINVLRHWEYLQLRCYLAAVQSLLQKAETRAHGSGRATACSAQPWRTYHKSPRTDSGIRTATEFLPRTSSIEKVTERFKNLSFANESKLWKTPKPCEMNLRLKSAVLRHDFDSATILMERNADIDMRDEKDEWTALHEACASDDIEAVRFLILKGANVAVRNKLGLTPFDLALLRERFAALNLLLDTGAQIESLSSQPNPLELAAHNGYVDGIWCLSHISALVDRCGHFGMTPLMSAAEMGHIEIVRILLSRGASASIRNDSGLTAFDYTKREDILRLLRSNS